MKLPRVGVLWLLLAPTAALYITAVCFWLRGTGAGELREQLARYQFWNLEFVFWACAACAATQARTLWQILRPARMPAIAAALLVVVLGAGLAPRTSRIFYDEQIYQHVAQNITDLHRTQVCTNGTVEYGSLQCFEAEYNKQPYGYPHMISLLYRLFGVQDGLARVLNNLVAALSVIVVVLIGLLLFECGPAAGFGGLVLVLTPEFLIWSNTAASEPTAACTAVLAVLSALLFSRTRATLALAWMVATTVWAAQFRPESLLVVPLVGMTVLVRAPGELWTPRFWWAALAGAMAGTGLIGHAFAVQHEPWGSQGARFTLDHLRNNAVTNGWFYLWDARFPAAFAALAVLGLTERRHWRGGLLMGTYLAVYWGVFAAFYAGSFDYGADVRYSLLTYPPIAVLAGLGCKRVVAWSSVSGASRRRAVTLVVVCLLVQFSWYIPLVRTVGEEAWAARADVAYAREFARRVPRNAVVLTQNPNMFLLWGTNAAQMSLLAGSDPAAAAFLSQRYAAGVYLHWNFWCNVSDPVQQDFCRYALERFPAELVAERRERDYRFGLYRLTLPRPADATMPGR